LKAAVTSGQPPLAVIFEDPSHVEWNVWDYRLYKAHHVLQDWYRDGVPIWWDESERVAFDAIPRTSKSRAAIERAQDSASNKKSVPGRYFIAEPKVIDGGDFPTMAEWLAEQAEKSNTVKPVTKFGNGPTSKGHIIQGR